METTSGRQAIERLRLDDVMACLSGRPGWTWGRAETAVSAYKDFLAVVLSDPGKAAHPTPDGDAVWHEHILDTARYRQDCQRIFGFFLDHAPGRLVPAPAPASASSGTGSGGVCGGHGRGRSFLGHIAPSLV